MIWKEAIFLHDSNEDAAKLEIVLAQKPKRKFWIEFYKLDHAIKIHKRWKMRLSCGNGLFLKPGLYFQRKYKRFEPEYKIAY